MTEPKVTDVAAGLSALAETGFCIHEGAFSAPEVAALRARLNDQAAQEIKTGVAVYENGLGGWRALHEGGQVGPIQVVEHLVNKGRIFMETAQHPTIKQYLSGILPKGHVTLSALFGFVVSNGALGQPIHVDQQDIGFETPFPVGVHVLVCVSDFDEDMGATRVVPGSHLAPLPELEYDPGTGTVTRKGPPPDTVAAVAKAGSLIIYDTRLQHGRGSSTSDKVRHSISMGFGYAWRTPFYNYAAIVHDDVYRALSDEDRALLNLAHVSRPSPRSLGPRFPGDFRGGNVPYIPELSRDGGQKVIMPAAS